MTPEQQAYLDTLTEQLRQAKQTIEQWTTYKSQLQDAIIALSGNDTEAVYADLEKTCKGSKKTKLGPFEISYTVEMSYDQGRMVSLVGQHPELIGTLVKIEYKPESAAKVYAFLKDDSELAQKLRPCLKVARRGPYVTEVKAKEADE